MTILKVLQVTNVTYITRLLRERELAEREQRLKAEQAPLLSDLRQAGFVIGDIWDFVNSPNIYRDALSILANHLTRDYSDKTKEGIARALAVKEAAYLWPLLVSEYVKAPQGLGRPFPGATRDYRLSSKSGLANALANTVTRSTLEELIGLLEDPVHGESRLILLGGVKRFRSQKAKDAAASFSL